MEHCVEQKILPCSVDKDLDRGLSKSSAVLC